MKKSFPVKTKSVYSESMNSNSSVVNILKLKIFYLVIERAFSLGVVFVKAVSAAMERVSRQRRVPLKRTAPPVGVSFSAFVPKLGVWCH